MRYRHPNPWDPLRDMPDWDVRIEPMVGKLLGWSDIPTKTIIIREGITQAQRRVVIAHEREHIRRGHIGECSPKIEHDIDKAVARYLIPIESLADSIRWSMYVGELADHLWVTRLCVLTRWKYLTDNEADEIRASLDRIERSA